MKLEQLAFILAILLCTFTSCVSCLTSIRRAIVMPLETAQKYYQSIAMVRSSDGPNGNAFSQGTAFAIDNNYLLTAGHVCESIQEKQGEGMAGPWVLLVESGPDGLPWDEAKGIILAIDSDIDACLILSPSHPFLPLTLSNNFDVVETEDPIVVVGAPAGRFPVRSEGFVAQKVALAVLGSYPKMKPMLIKVDIEGGSSGSPVLWGGEVIGMAVMTAHRPHASTLAVPVTQLLDFVEKNT